MSINDQIAQLIAAAKASGLSEQQITDEISVRWDSGADAQLKLDKYGRHSIAGSKHLWLSPLPLIAGAKLDKLQLVNIQTNVGVDEAGNEVAAFGLGFKDETGGDQAVAYLTARRHEEGDKPGTDNGPFKPRTFRSRFRTMDEAVAYVAANPWVQ